MNWQEFKDLSTEDIAAARLHLHFATQPLASAAVALAEHKPDFSHTSFTFDVDTIRFISAPLFTKEGTFYAYFDLAVFNLGLMNEQKSSVAEISMWSKKLQAGFDFLSEELSKHGEPVKLDFPEYPDFPESDLKESASFDEKNKSAIVCLAGMFQSSAKSLSGVQGQTGASPIRTWPHHFDMAVLVTLEGDFVKDASVGVGFSPGDGGVPDPYWYVTPWPYPDASKLPSILPPANWNTEGWIGGVLSSRKLAETENGDSVLTEYMDDTFNKSRDLLKN